MTPQNYYARRSVRSRQEVDLALVLALVKAEREQQPRLGVQKALPPDCARTQSRGSEAGAGPALCGAGQGGLAGGEKALGMAQNHAG